jgi:hypothetical protein
MTTTINDDTVQVPRAARTESRGMAGRHLDMSLRIVGVAR